MTDFIYKVADEPEEIEQVHALNYKTFVEEIPQHPANNTHQLIDKFHSENTYLIGKQKGNVVAMMALRDQHPFSLDFKLQNLDQYLPPHHSLCEIRLLAVEKSFRHSRLFSGLMSYFAETCLAKGYDLALISGTTRQLSMYQHIGFVPFAHLVGNEPALFQPMYLTKDAYTALKENSRALRR
jgi:hypothetical protein